MKTNNMHEIHRDSVNFQRGNTKEQRIQSIIDSWKAFPESVGSIGEMTLAEIKGYGIDIKELSGYHHVTINKKDKLGIKHEIKIIVNSKTGTQNIKITPANHIKDYYYAANKVSNENIKEELSAISSFIDTGSIPSNSSLKIVNLGINYDSFDAADFVQEKDLKGFSQARYDEIAATEGPKEAVRYATGYRE